MVRLLLASLLPGEGSVAGPDAVPAGQVAGADQLADDPTEQALRRIARALRDAGHEVVHAGQGLAEAVVVAAAVQEDVEGIVLLAPPSYDADALSAHVSRHVGEEAGEDVPVVAVTAAVEVAGEAGRVVQRVAQQLRAGVVDDTSRGPSDQG